jgi:DNA helicase HerA-like ATPase
MPAQAKLNPFDRVAIIGKTGSGKTRLAIVIASYFAQTLGPPWEVWWIDTKNVKEDIEELINWGAVNGSSEKHQKRRGGLRNFKFFIITPEPGYSTVEQAQGKLQEAYERGHVIVVIDEYTQVVISNRTPGQPLKDVFTRGRGRNVGLIGLTQEPVNVPRMLMSQASHLVLFTVTYPYDIDYCKKLCKIYTPPQDQGNTHGFYWSHIDGTAKWAYYENQKEWAAGVKIQLPKEPTGAATN